MNKDNSKATILFVECPLHNSADHVFSLAKSNEDLVDAINLYKAKLIAENDIEIFDQKDNIIVTENAYVLAVYETDIVARVGEDQADAIGSLITSIKNSKRIEE